MVLERNWCQPPDATRRDSDKTLACEELWISRDAMREALSAAAQETCTLSRFGR
jgi:hypothetical protein